MVLAPHEPGEIDTGRAKRGFKSGLPLLRGQLQRYGVKLFFVLASDKTRDNGHELRLRRFRLDMRANTSPGKMMQVRTGHHRGGGDLCPRE